jgi:superfamily II DNA or RNA helicase
MPNRTLQSKKKNTHNKTPPKLELSTDYIESIRSTSYLGKKGYTILKSFISKEDEEFLRKELFVKPVVMGATFAASNEVAFPVFRENSNKMYLPRFFGIERYGRPNKCEVDPGDDISVPFVKSLRDYQDKIVDVYMKHCENNLCSQHLEKGNGGILEVPCGAGKTVMALKIISLLSKKTMILVHKEFLMNQWIERIAEFLPSARIGKIQASTFDIQDKDIVIGMIQTLYDKEYSADTFSSFGLTIIDEVHRIGSEQFSRTLFKTITPYMLGISATVERKDKLTKILYWFIGNKIYSEGRKGEDPVSVRAIEYKTNDTEFNQVEVDFRGNTKYSTMITKLCAFGPRSDFILRVIKDLLEETDNQIMILCHNRSLLSYLFDGVKHRNLASVGYYVGGMKQVSLQETEEKQIVLATYAMAAEALDIKTLATLVMVTPKTDITQSVGRILRVKHESPIIVDIVDSHEIFQNQWTQRRRFYKKCNYRILYIDSLKYSGMSIDWHKDMAWKKVFEPKSLNEKTKEKDDDFVESNYKDSSQSKCLIDVSSFQDL